MIDYDRVNYGAITSMLRTSSSTDLFVSTAQIEFDHLRVDDYDSSSSDIDNKFAF